MLLVAKFLDGLPLARFEHVLARHGVLVPRRLPRLFDDRRLRRLQHRRACRRCRAHGVLGARTPALGRGGTRTAQGQARQGRRDGRTDRPTVWYRTCPARHQRCCVCRHVNYVSAAVTFSTSSAVVTPSTILCAPAMRSGFMPLATPCRRSAGRSVASLISFVKSSVIVNSS